jgi:cytochrome c oxidase assembly protein subunit 15
MTVEIGRNERWVAIWLTICAVTIFGMILLGGVTRLTDSGLSMVEWQPLLGVIPPLNDAEWLIAFESYKNYPEYQKINFGMDLEGFKAIYWYEYLHRVLGRLIGLLFFVPLLYLALRRRIPQGYTPHLFLLLVLGGCQGLLGWYMVQSGLVDRPDVSQYRLTAHLGLAVAIYAYIITLILQLTASNPVAPTGVARISPWLVPVTVYVMVLSGGFVAGTDAGLSYPTWPLMGDRLVPTGLYADGLTAAFEDVTTIHFNHRMLAYVTVAILLAVALRGVMVSTDRRVRLASVLIGVAVLLQASFGVATVLSHVQVPIAAMHQGGAIILLTAALFWAHAKRTENVRSRF